MTTFNVTDAQLEAASKTFSNSDNYVGNAKLAYKLLTNSARAKSSISEMIAIQADVDMDSDIVTMELSSLLGFVIGMAAVYLNVGIELGRQERP